jgi:membrane protease YdiL (CAAX protease family)
MKQWVARHDTAAFVVLTYGLSWPLWLASGALGRTPVRTPDLRWLVAQIGVFAPALAGMTVGACVDRAGVIRALRLVAAVYLPAVALGFWIATRGFASFVAMDRHTTWAMGALAVWALVWLSRHPNRLVEWPVGSARRGTVALASAGSLLAPAVLFILAWSATSQPSGQATSIPPLPVRDPTVFGVFAALVTNLSYGGALGEEPGWRGFWLPRLLERHPPLAASVVISFWWALWHAPIDVSQGFGLAGVGALVVRQVWTLPVSVIFTWVTLRSGGSLLPPLVLHTSLNAIPDFVLDQPERYQEALVVFWLFLVACAIGAAAGDSRLRRPCARPGSCGRS